MSNTPHHRPHKPSANGSGMSQVELAARSATSALADRINPVFVDLHQAVTGIPGSVAQAVHAAMGRPCAPCLAARFHWTAAHTEEWETARQDALAAAVKAGEVDGPDDPRVGGLDITPFLPEHPPTVFNMVSQVGGTDMCEMHLAATIAQQAPPQDATPEPASPPVPRTPLIAAPGLNAATAAKAAYQGAPGMPGVPEAPFRPR